MNTIHHYFNELGVLTSRQSLLDECERRFVKVKEHPGINRLLCLNYKDNVQYDKCWDNFNRRCRGLVVSLEKNKIGKIISHSYDKFFNLNEMPETSYETLVTKGPFKISEKLDGSMIVAGYDGESNSWILNTRSEFENDYTKCAYSLLPSFFDQEEQLKNYTLIFELIHQDFRNVIDYKKKNYKEGLYLLGMRDIRTDRLLSRNEIEEIRIASRPLQYFDMPKVYHFDTLDQVMEKTKTLPFTEEGFVIWYPDNTLVKIKSLEYIKIHRLIWNYSDDRVLEVLQEGTEKELREYMVGVPEEFVKEIEEAITKAKRAELEYTKQIYNLFNNAPRNNRKDFAIWVNSNVPLPLRSHLFTVMDNKPILKNKLFKQMRDDILAWK